MVEEANQRRSIHSRQAWHFTNIS